MYKCEFSFFHENCWLIDVSSGFPQLTFVDKAIFPNPKGDLMEMCLVRGNIEDIRKVAGFLRGHKSVVSVTTVEQGRNYLLLLVTGSPKTMFSTTVFMSRFNCYRMGDIVAKNGCEKWIVAAPRKSDINALIFSLESHGKITSKRTVKTTTKIVQLTKKQRRALALAYHNRYYNIPRGIDLGKLASKMGINKSTFREHLARAEKKVINDYLEE
jgi:predicted DNA binding protein